MKQKAPRIDARDVDEHIREALERPIEERVPLDLPKPKPVDALEHGRLRPVAKNVKHRVPR